jgi:hypothetical protein
LAAVAAQLGVSATALLGQVKKARTFGELWARVQATAPGASVPLVPLSMALYELPRLL